MTVYDVAAAAAFLGLKTATLKYHVYSSKTLIPDGKVGNSLFFYEETLTTWKNTKRVVGRPKFKRPGRS